MKERDEQGNCRCCGASEEDWCYQPEQELTLSQVVEFEQAVGALRAIEAEKEAEKKATPSVDLVIDFNRALMIISNYLSQQHLPQQSVAVSLEIVKDFIRLNVPMYEQNFAIAHQSSKAGAMMDQYLQISRQLAAKFAAWRVDYMREVRYELGKEGIEFLDSFMAQFGANLHRIFYVQQTITYAEDENGVRTLVDEKMRVVNPLSFTQFFENRKDENTGELFLFNNIAHAENMPDQEFDSHEAYTKFLRSYQIVAT